jgi:glycine betaine/proline transport system ATP-binding protein
MKDGEIVQIGTPSDVVMRPATDYVTEFTRDVPRVKVLTVGDVAEPAAADLGAGAAVIEDMTLEQLLPRFTAGVHAIAVADASGRVTGQVTAQGVLHALANAREGAD